MKKNKLTRALAVAAAVTTVLLVAAPAQAASVTVSDPLGDTRVYGGLAPTAAQKRQIDLTKVNYWHTSDGRVGFRWTVRDLRSDLRIPQFDWATTTTNHWRVTNKTFGSTRFSVMVGSTTRCTATGGFNWTNNHVTVRFPRSCFAKGLRVNGSGIADFRSATAQQWVYDNTSYGAAFTPNP